MNILPKKKWHVRTKENMARVRRDERKAAELEKSRLDRALLAEQEDRVRKLKEKASERYGPSVFDRSIIADEGEPGPSVETNKHVNLFASLEEEERKNLTSGNAEYVAEKKKEKDEWESKMGIMKYLAEGSNELTKTTSWYDKPPDRSIYSVDLPLKKSIARPIIAKPFIDRIHPYRKKEIEKKSKKEKKHKNKKRKRRSSSSESESSTESESEKDRKRTKLEQLRAERVAREKAERIKVEQLLNPKKEPPTPVETQKYNSMFNPEFARQNKKKEERRY